MGDISDLAAAEEAAGVNDTATTDSGDDGGSLEGIPSGSFENRDSPFSGDENTEVSVSYSGDLDLSTIDNTFGSRDVITFDETTDDVEVTISGDLTLANSVDNFWDRPDILATQFDMSQFQIGYTKVEMYGFISGLKQVSGSQQIMGALASGLASTVTGYVASTVGSTVGSIVTNVVTAVLMGIGLAPVGAIAVGILAGAYAGYKTTQAVDATLNAMVDQYALNLPTPSNPRGVAPDTLSEGDQDTAKEFFSKLSQEEYEEYMYDATISITSSVIPISIYTQKSNIIGSGSPVIV